MNTYDLKYETRMIPLEAIEPEIYSALTGQLCGNCGCRAADVLIGARRQIDKPEEEVGGDLLEAMIAMIQEGAVHCSTASPDLKAITIGGETILTQRSLH